jgi:four helix bundle protein
MMGTLQNFEEMEIWKEARRLFKRVIDLTEDGPVCSDFRFKSQIRQVAGSIMDNIAEGFERDSRLEFINHLSYSKGSTGETRSQLYRGYDMNYWSEEEAISLIEEYKQLASHIANFIKYLNTCDIKGNKFKRRQS